MPNAAVLLDPVTVGSLFLLFVFYLRARWARARLPYPPGPKPLPLIGNLFDFPRVTPWVTYRQMAKQYGDVISLRALGHVVVVLNSVDAARELLEKRGAIYSDRPAVPFLEMMDMDFHLSLSRYPSPWRMRRKLIDRSFRPSATLQYRSVQQTKVKHFLRKLLANPEGFDHHVAHCMGSILLAINYDYDLKDIGDRYTAINEEVSSIASESILPGATIVNNVPFLKYLPGWLPGMEFQARAQRGLILYQEMINVPFLHVKEQWKNGTATRSFTSDNLQVLGDEKEETEIKNAAATLNAAGIETTGSVSTTLFLMLASYPDVQKKAQAELDAVVGRDRLPDWADRPQLPYIQAVCNELTRWQPVTPLGVAHATTEDDIYEGYLIPKGAVVIANSWAILHDPAVYPSPETFMPERHLTADGAVKEDPLLSAAFGFGRRMCPGRHLADSTLWIFVASVIASFQVDKAKDAEGQEIPLDVAYTDGLVSLPKPFKCAIAPRDERAASLVKSSAHPVAASA
ncbi:cytochrome P450 [Artomyces pyxidatus]|uniref:Cytochrome P450 n=1 Tax=Artomyces pyxidatus TaxID=48021 RepID=A0ACB8T060_9AGAM|nr:cytochrome P450 [Artomyces pyxidatus]